MGFGTFHVKLFEIFEVLEAAWLVKALIVAFLTAALTTGRDSVVRHRGILAFVAFMFVVLSNVPLAVTAKYQIVGDRELLARLSDVVLRVLRRRDPVRAADRRIRQLALTPIAARDLRFLRHIRGRGIFRVVWDGPGQRACGIHRASDVRQVENGGCMDCESRVSGDPRR